MPALREIIHGPWRAVPVLGVTQIVAWGVLFYSPVLMAPLIAIDRGWSPSFAFAGFSLGLLAAGCIAPYGGIMIDRYGGHRVMPLGSLLGALGLCGLVLASNRIAYVVVWMLLGAAMGVSLYDSAFATLARIFGGKARGPITAVVAAGGFASTVSWPTTHLLTGTIGWQSTYLVYAGLLGLLAAPLHFLALPRSYAEPETPAAETVEPVARLSQRSASVAIVAAVFAANAFVFSGLSAHLLAIFNRIGLDQCTVIAIGALMGPSQVVARLCQLLFIRQVHPLWVARFAVAMLITAFTVLALFGLSGPVAVTFIVMFGATNGLMAIARGSVPLALFGSAGYGRIIGRMSGPQFVMQSAAPLVLAFVVERSSDVVALALVAAVAIAELACLAAIGRPTGY